MNSGFKSPLQKSTFACRNATK